VSSARSTEDLDARTSLSQYVETLRTGYRDNVGEYATGVLLTAACIARVLDEPGLTGSQLCSRMERLCDDLFSIYSTPAGDYCTGVMVTAADLYIALSTYPDPARWGRVSDAVDPALLGLLSALGRR
jgi:hypothetical protein